MTGREHAPRPGVTWQQQPVRREVVVPDGPWGGPVHVAAWDDKVPASAPPWQADQPANRAARRALKRAQRRKGKQPR